MARDFDGSTGFAIASNVAGYDNITSAGTQGCWIFPDSIGNPDIVMAKCSGLGNSCSNVDFRIDIPGAAPRNLISSGG